MQRVRVRHSVETLQTQIKPAFTAHNGQYRNALQLDINKNSCHLVRFTLCQDFSVIIPNILVTLIIQIKKFRKSYAQGHTTRR